MLPISPRFTPTTWFANGRCTNTLWWFSPSFGTTGTSLTSTRYFTTWSSAGNCSPSLPCFWTLRATVWFSWTLIWRLEILSTLELRESNTTWWFVCLSWDTLLTSFPKAIRVLLLALSISTFLIGLNKKNSYLSWELSCARSCYWRLYHSSGYCSGYAIKGHQKTWGKKFLNGTWHISFSSLQSSYKFSTIYTTILFSHGISTSFQILING